MKVGNKWKRYRRKPESELNLLGLKIIDPVIDSVAAAINYQINPLLTKSSR